MPRPVPVAVLFASERAANALVAGVPAAARLVRNIAADRSSGDDAEILLAVPGGWQPSGTCRSELARLAPETGWRVVDATSMGEARWHELPDSGAAQRALDLPELRAWSRRIIRATGKPGDGIVSRNINRPISQAMTCLFLRWQGARPWHATLAAALIGAAMIVALFFGGASGLLVGAVLFQLASIVDGVDGETARATFRTSARGAMMDSMTDLATNLGFIAGVSYNVYARGDEAAGIAGAAGFGLLAVGSAILARQSRRDGGDFTFDALKTRVRTRPSLIRQWLVWITMRDFYALAACLAILAGGARALLFAFAIVATGWFLAVCAMLAASVGGRR